MYDFSGRTAIVTGAAQGLGASYARLLAGMGAHVVIADIALDKAKATAESIVAAGGKAAAVETDVGSVAACEACAAFAVETFGRIDYLVNNAGLLTAAREKRLHEIDYERYHRITDVMLSGMLYLTRAALPALRERGGAIVNTSSIGAWTAHGIYSLTKAGVNALTVCLARELAPFGIRVNAIAPGALMTEGTRDSLGRDRAQMEEWALKGGKPTKDVADPEDIADAGIFLLSDAARFITGAILNVDGGQMVRL
jgi:NAD(P)-dependent dehydrogenase (short-subunit alcohol dehydrogenase family)